MRFYPFPGALQYTAHSSLSPCQIAAILNLLESMHRELSNLFHIVRYGHKLGNLCRSKDTLKFALGFVLPNKCALLATGKNLLGG